MTNRREADVICSMVQQLLGHGVPPSAIGIICFFRAQVGDIGRGWIASMPAGRWVAEVVHCLFAPRLCKVWHS